MLDSITTAVGWISKRSSRTRSNLKGSQSRRRGSLSLLCPGVDTSSDTHRGHVLDCFGGRLSGTHRCPSPSASPSNLQIQPHPPPRPQCPSVRSEGTPYFTCMLSCDVRADEHTTSSGRAAAAVRWMVAPFKAAMHERDAVPGIRLRGWTLLQSMYRMYEEWAEIGRSGTGRLVLLFLLGSSLRSVHYYTTVHAQHQINATTLAPRLTRPSSICPRPRLHRESLSVHL
ncbi:hypothetical protein HDK77DRAFT_193019 [Phyllosticta capitalensis]|uniref:uncharacterized protein n=1 Tax=Phyllosticta capitalensis TaxID=121624 RepID=UPI00312F024E